MHGSIFLISYRFIYKYIDKLLLELLGPAALYNTINLMSLNLRRAHSGIIFIYVLYFLVVLILALLIPLTFSGFFYLF